MRIHLLRHGQLGPDDRHRLDGYCDPPLNDVGIEQARALGDRLRRCGPIEALYTSDLRHTRQTADILARYLDATPRVEPSHLTVFIHRLGATKSRLIRRWSNVF